MACGCAHTVRLDSKPPGAQVLVDGVHVGRTPVDFRETTGWNRRYEVTLTLPGHRELKAAFQQSEWDNRIALPLVAMMWFPPSWPAILFSRRARHGYHWDLDPDPGAAAAEARGSPGYPPPGTDYPPPDTDYPPPNPEYPVPSPEYPPPNTPPTDP